MRQLTLLLPVLALAASALACGGQSLPEGVKYQTDFASKPLLESNQWSTGSSGSSSADYVNGAFNITVTRDKWLAWSNAPEATYSNIRIEVTAVNNSGAGSDAAFGVICNYRNENDFYYLGIGSDGYYAIIKESAGNSEVLTDPAENMWQKSDVIAIDAPSYKLAAECANGQLALYVDGKEVAVVNDSSYTSGNIGLFVLTFEQARADITFDDLVVREVK